MADDFWEVDRPFHPKTQAHVKPGAMLVFAGLWCFWLLRGCRYLIGGARLAAEQNVLWGRREFEAQGRFAGLSCAFGVGCEGVVC